MKFCLTLALSVLFMFTSFGFKNTPPTYLVSSNLVKSHTKQSLAALWKRHHIPKIALPIKNDVDIYEIMYKAPWIDSSTWINCSGIVYVPKLKGKKAATFMFGHGTEILKGVDLTINQGEIHALMGPNGSGKSTLANTLLGHPKYKVTKGDVLIDGESIINLTSPSQE